MTDRELLEAAARAAGYPIDSRASFRTWREFDKVSVLNPKGGHTLWNPLSDDGDALRLAVALRITPHIDSNMTEAEAATRQAGGFFAEPHIDDPYAATRRAIVRAAAALAGKTP